MKKSIPKRILSGVLATALAVSILPAAAAIVNAGTASDTTTFTFSNSGITTQNGNGTGYKINGTELTIQKSGTYSVSGSCSDGSIQIKKGTTGVTLVLNGLTLTSADTAPLSCNKSTEVTIVAASGTTNTLTDSANNNDGTNPDNEDAENAVIKCKDGSDVTICGTGTLKFTANGKNGIKSGATTAEEGMAALTIRDVKLNITAPVNDAINAEQQLNIESGTLTISAADDAIHSDLVLNIGANSTADPTIRITDCYEGLKAATLNIFSGNLEITASDDCLNAANSDLSNYDFSMNISGGTINASSTSGDGFDSNGDLTISGGAVTVWTANMADNQPLDADGTLTLSGGTVLAAGGSSGMGVRISATQPYVIFGTTSGMGGRPMGNRQSTATIAKDGSFSIRDNAGDAVYSGTAICNANYVLFSSAKLTAENSYTLYSGNTNAATATAQTGTADSACPFSDIPAGSYCKQASTWAAANQIVCGYGNGCFGADDAVTREQLAAILYRYAQYKGYDTSDSTVLTDFSDWADVSGYAKPAVAWANAAGLIQGGTTGTLAPKDTATRA